MKVISIVFLVGWCCTLANGQDYATVNVNFVSSLVDVSSNQYQRSLSYITEYTTASSQLAQASSYLFVTLQNVVNITNVQSFLSNIQNHLNENVQKLVLKYSPTNVRNFVVYFYQTFLTNLSNNNGTQSEILTMNLLYMNNILKANATECMSKYNANHYKVYLEAAVKFTQLMSEETSSTAVQLETLRKEIQSMVVSIVKSVEKIIANRATAREEFDNFIKINEKTILDKVDSWVSQFNVLLKATQSDIKNGFKKYDEQRVDQTLEIVRETLKCLASLN